MPSTAGTLPLIDQIVSDENVTAALVNAIVLGCSRVLQDWRPGDSPVGYVPSRSYLEGVTLATSSLRPFNYLASDLQNQRHLSNYDRYDQPLQIVISSARKVDSGFRVAHKGAVTLHMVENCGQYAMLLEGYTEVPDPACFWVLFEINEHTRVLKIYLARPSRLLFNGTLLETTEFRVLFDNIIGAMPQTVGGDDVPAGPEFSVVVEEIPAMAEEIPAMAEEIPAMAEEIPAMVEEIPDLSQ